MIDSVSRVPASVRPTGLSHEGGNGGYVRTLRIPERSRRICFVNWANDGRYSVHMNRRHFVSNLAGAAGLLPVRASGQSSDPGVKRVLVMFKCHLDVGFVDTQAAIVKRYFEQYFPLAIRTARGLRQENEDRYVWTTGSWLLYEYLEQAGSAERKAMEQAIVDGDIAWHALPFTWQTELLNGSAIEGAVGFSKSLDRRFGRRTTGAKMTDVPGHSRGIIGSAFEERRHIPEYWCPRK